MPSFSFFDRDLSWLSFNERVLTEAAGKNVFLVERIKFLSIYSSNLDEFYRVRVPSLTALQKITSEGNELLYTPVLAEVTATVQKQQELFGQIWQELILEMKDKGICIIYNQPLPAEILPFLKNYFFTQILAFIRTVRLTENTDFFPGNNKLFMAVILTRDGGKEEIAVVNIPSDKISRFVCKTVADKQYIVFIEDIIKEFLPLIFRNALIRGAYNFKITRNAELNLEDEYEDDIAEQIEIQISKRDFGLATRFLYDPAIPLRTLQFLTESFRLEGSGIVAGGIYHNLKDLDFLPVSRADLEYDKWPSLPAFSCDKDSLLDEIAKRDILLHAPYQSFDTILRFFNEAAIDDEVKEIYTTLYRVANDSKIVNALISAAKNGKKVVVLVELKARFDEANNIKWARKMKAAGVKIIYSVIALKVHAKTALVKKRNGNRDIYYGLFSTGNLNESTARFYTDHVLLTAHPGMLREAELLFLFLSKRTKRIPEGMVTFNYLLIAKFNLQQRFIEMIDREIDHKQKGLAASIIIKMNNLEEKILISKLYEASNAGVKIQLIVRSICCLVPGITGQSENIIVTRIVDRYLEHGRVFIFHNDGNEEIYLGSADWMNRNIYRRIEVCFPLFDPGLKKQVKDIIQLQLHDGVQAVHISSHLQNIIAVPQENPVRSQLAIYEYLNKAKHEKE